MLGTSRKLLADERRVLIEFQLFRCHLKQEYSEPHYQVETRDHLPNRTQKDA